MIGSLVGFNQKNKVDDIMLSVDSAFWTCIDRNIMDIMIVIHPDTIEWYMDNLHGPVMKRVLPDLSVDGPVISVVVPKNHIWFCSKESLDNGRVQSYDRKSVDSSGGAV